MPEYALTFLPPLHHHHDQIWLKETSYTVGRAAAAGITIDRPDVSSAHCRITKEDDGFWYVEDLKSTNGTYINDQPVRVKTVIRFNDILSLGDVRLRVAIVENPVGDGSPAQSSFSHTYVCNRATLFNKHGARLKAMRALGKKTVCALLVVLAFLMLLVMAGHFAGF